MPPRERAGSGASGRRSLATFRDTDYEDFLAVVDWLPTMTRDYGSEATITFIQTEVRSQLALLAVAGEVPTEIGGFFSRGQAMLLKDEDEAGFNFRAAFKAVVTRLVFEPSVPTVFERASATEEEPYAPEI